MEYIRFRSGQEFTVQPLTLILQCAVSVAISFSHFQALWY